MAMVYLVPKVISIVKYKRLMDKPNERSSHKKATPSLGGIAFYIVFIFSMYFNDRYDSLNISMSILPGLTLLFFLGLKDDLVVLAPSTKLLGQMIACLFVLVHYKFEVGGLHGFFGIHEVHPIVGGTIGLIMMLTIINAFNLIDGIDGLASSIGIVAFSSFAVLFFMLELYFLALSALTMCGILSGFLIFNLSQKERRRIFMGDTGSMLIGFLIAVMSVRLMAIEPEFINKLPFDKIYLPLVIISIITIPLYDTIRVFVIRILAGRSPFSADRNHLHHIILDSFGMSHRRTTFIIAAFSGVSIVMAYLLINYTTPLFTGIALILGVFLVSWLLYRLKSDIDKKRFEKNLQKKNDLKTRHKSKKTQIVNPSFKHYYEKI